MDFIYIVLIIICVVIITSVLLHHTKGSENSGVMSSSAAMQNTSANEFSFPVKAIFAMAGVFFVLILFSHTMNIKSSDVLDNLETKAASKNPTDNSKRTKEKTPLVNEIPE